ncbi:MAG: alpha/beta hydrolase, partial [Anaerolineales bacterium]
MANRFVLLLSVFFFLGLSLAAGPLILAQAQSGGSRWIGAYALGDAVYLFRLEIPLSEEGTQFYQFGEPFPQAVRDLIVAGDTVQFSVRTPTGLARFSGFMEGERITGEVEIRGSLGNFVLLPAGVDLDPDPNVYIGDYRFISGSRNGEEILVSRGDQPDQFFYFHQGILTRIYATRSDQFLSARAEVVDFERNPSGAIRGLTIQDVFQLGQHGVEELVVTHPYRREEVSFKSGPVKLSGTLFLPNGEGPFPAVSLLHGAGAAERHFYRIYAAYFARSGIAALVYDKRGSGKSSYTGIEPSLEDLAGDATASLAYLASHPAIDPRAVGVWGLSQGGRIAP